MGSSNPLRKLGDVAMEDVRGGKTQIFYNESTDQIVHVSFASTGEMKVTVVDIWDRAEYTYDVNKDVIYKGVHVNHDADGSESDWRITKYTYNGDSNVTIKQVLDGVWNNRAGLGW